MSLNDRSSGSRGSLLSVLIPAYNERHYLRRYVERVLNVALPSAFDRETIIVDDSSTDDTGDIADAFAILGWWTNSCLLKRRDMSRAQLKLYDSMVPVLRIVERMLPLPGMSILYAGRQR